MKRKMNRRTQLMIIVGLLFTSGVPLLARYTPIPDFVRGALSGFGIGIMIVALIWQRKTSVCAGDGEQVSG